MRGAGRDRCAEGLPVHVIGTEFLAEAMTEPHPAFRRGRLSCTTIRSSGERAHPGAGRGQPFPDAGSCGVSLRCLQRPLAPDDIVGPVLFLASDAAGMVTRQTLIVAGGRAFL